MRIRNREKDKKITRRKHFRRKLKNFQSQIGTKGGRSISDKKRADTRINKLKALASRFPDKYKFFVTKEDTNDVSIKAKLIKREPQIVEAVTPYVAMQKLTDILLVSQQEHKRIKHIRKLRKKRKSALRERERRYIKRVNKATAESSSTACKEHPRS